ncbi:MAG: hypothetical protein JWN77_2754 [Frankiales bacterium]|jgi:hypothetical protein|nr:hypothetical protein [Frankiales bacterium]
MDEQQAQAEFRRAAGDVLGRHRSGWALTVYPDAAEAGGGFVGARRRHSTGVRGHAEHPERAASEAARRARGQVRRYCASNRLNRLATLTYAVGCHDLKQLRDDVAVFFRRLRMATGGRDLPYLWVGEWHPGGHGLHVHFAVGRYIRKHVIRDAWGLGLVHIKLLGDLPVGSGELDEARLAARYLGKYVSKTLDGAAPGMHRYEVAEGFQPRRLRVEGRSLPNVLDEASAVFGVEPDRVWLSQNEKDWQGPPAVWASWAA